MDEQRGFRGDIFRQRDVLEWQVSQADEGNLSGLWRYLMVIPRSSEGDSRVRTLRRKLERVRAKVREARGRQ